MFYFLNNKAPVRQIVDNALKYGGISYFI